MSETKSFSDEGKPPVAVQPGVASSLKVRKTAAGTLSSYKVPVYESGKSITTRYGSKTAITISQKKGK